MTGHVQYSNWCPACAAGLAECSRLALKALRTGRKAWLGRWFQEVERLAASPQGARKAARRVRQVIGKAKSAPHRHACG